MRRAGRIALALLAAAVLLVLAGVFVPNLLRQRVALAAGLALHRSVAIGNLRLLPAWPPTLQASDVTVAGLGTVAQIRARLAPSALFGNPAVIEQVVLLRPSLTVVPDAQGHVSLGAAPPSEPPAVAAAPASPAHAARPVSVQHLVIQDGTLVWRDPRIGPPLTVAVSGRRDGDAYDLVLHGVVPPGTRAPWLTGATASAHFVSGQPLRATLVGSLNGHAVQAVIVAGTPEAMAATGPVPLDITVAASGATAHATGKVGEWRALSGLDLAVSLRAGSEAALAGLAGLQTAAAGAVSLDAHLTGGADRLEVQALALHAPQGDLSGDLTFTQGARPSLHGTLRSQALDLDALLALLASKSPPPPPPAVGPVPPSPPSPTLISDRPLSLAALGLVDAHLTMQAAGLRLAGIDYRDLAGHLVLRERRLVLDPFAAVLPGGVHLDATARLDGAATPPGAALTLRAPAVALAPLLAALHLPPAATGTAALAADLHASGDSPHALAADLGGTAALRMAGGTVEAGLLSAVFGAAHLPIPLGHGHLGLRCLALGATAVRGVLTMAPLLVDAGPVVIQGGGTVDLGQETLALHLRPLLRAGPGLVVPVQLTGRWRAPRLLPDNGPASVTSSTADACQAAGIAVPATAPPVSKKLPNSAELLRRLFR